MQTRLVYSPNKACFKPGDIAAENQRVTASFSFLFVFSP